MSRCVIVCQSRACRQRKSDEVLEAFQALPVAEVTVEGRECLGQCGNGPMVLVMPEEIWYSGVLPEEVTAIVERHLRGGQPISAMLYKRFH